MEEKGGKEEACKQQSQEWPCSLALLFKIGSILMMPF